MKSREIIEGKLVQASQKHTHMKEKLRLTFFYAALSLSDAFSLQSEGPFAAASFGAELALFIMAETWKVGSVEETR